MSRLFRLICKSSSVYTFSPVTYSRYLHLAVTYRNKNSSMKIPALVPPRFEVFEDEKSPEILDVQEERRKNEELLIVDEKQEDDTQESIFDGISPERGLTGVMEVEELVHVLHQERAKNIFVVGVPKEYQYVDYIVVVSGKSVRHMKAMLQFVLQVYKYKRHSTDIVPKTEGNTSSDWMAVDLGNIALHIFSPSTRNRYDLESLWVLGSKFDNLYNTEDDPLTKYLNEYQQLQQLIPNTGSNM